MDDLAGQLLERVRGSGSVLLTGPEGPDGDSIGACLALRRALRRLAPGVRIDVAGSPGHRYGFLPDAPDMIPDPRVGSYDGVVVLDGDRRRLPAEVGRAFRDAAWTGIVDHHRSTDTAGYDLAVFDPDAESTCGMVYALMQAWGVALDRDVATLLYAGVIFDTGCFRYSNTRASTHRLAVDLLDTGIDHADITLRILLLRRQAAIRLLARMLSTARFLAGGRIALAVCPRALMEDVGAGEGDLEGIVDVLQHTEGVELAIVVVERASERVKLSLRSAGSVDVSALAKSLHANGGGHAKAAGVSLQASLAAVVERIEREVVPRFSD